MKIAASPRGALCRAAGLVLAAMVAAVVAGCATPPSDPAERIAFEQNHDPLEPLNRQTLDLNLFVDRILLKPATQVYIAIVPEEGRDAVKRALDNMKEPVVVINNVLQGEIKRAGVSVGRFTVNTTLGLAGLLDIAAKMGLEKESGDFGQTLFVWGLPEGPYLILPILGPSNPRDLIGMGVDAYSIRSAFWRPRRVWTRSRSPDSSSMASISALASWMSSMTSKRTRSISMPSCAAFPSRSAPPSCGTEPRPSRGRTFTRIRINRLPPSRAPLFRSNRDHRPAPHWFALGQTRPRRRDHPDLSAAVRCSIIWTSPSAPLRCKTAANSERRVANSLTVPLRYTSMTFHEPAPSCRSR